MVDAPATPIVAHPSDNDVRAALLRVVESDGFVRSPRLQRFLRYVVNEEIEGRGQDIRGKTIAVDVYDRSLDSATDAMGVVRVEARRLRRLLEEYYATVGQSEEIRIAINPGGYRPRIETLPPSQKDRGEDRPRQIVWGYRVVLPALLAIAVVGSIGFFGFRATTDDSTGTAADARRLALMDKSPTAVQAANMAAQARGMLFPLFDLQRQKAVTELFRHAISLEPALPDGYAGAAQSLATLAILSPDRAAGQDLLAEAFRMSDQALKLGPDNEWAHAATAWVNLFGGDKVAGLKHAEIARKLAPENGYVLDVVGVAGLMTNQPDLAAQATDPSRPRNGKGRFGALSIWAVAQYHLGNYQNTIDAFEKAAIEGAPISAPTLIYLAAAYDQLGKASEAGKKVNELNEAWPGFPVKNVLQRFFGDDPVINDLEARLLANGLKTE